MDSFTDLADALYKTARDVSDEDTRAWVQIKAAAVAKIQRIRSSPRRSLRETIVSASRRDLLNHPQQPGGSMALP